MFNNLFLWVFSSFRRWDEYRLNQQKLLPTVKISRIKSRRHHGIEVFSSFLGEVFLRWGGRKVGEMWQMFFFFYLHLFSFKLYALHVSCECKMFFLDRKQDGNYKTVVLDWNSILCKKREQIGMFVPMPSLTPSENLLNRLIFFRWEFLMWTLQ